MTYLNSGKLTHLDKEKVGPSTIICNVYLFKKKSEKNMAKCKDRRIKPKYYAELFNKPITVFKRMVLKVQPINKLRPKGIKREV